MRVLPGRRTLALHGGIQLIVGLAAGVFFAHTRALPWVLVAMAIVVAAGLISGVRGDQQARTALARRARDAETANEAKSGFLANMSHELRTPLNGIMGFAELLHDGRLGPVSQPQEEGLADILTSSRHLLELVNDILDLSRVEAGRLEVRPELVDPGVVAADCVDALRCIADAAEVTVVLHRPRGADRFWIDPGKLRQVLINYLHNAISFTPAGGNIRIQLKIAENRLRLEVSDDGPGIAARDHERVFLEFEQLHHGLARRSAGTGLGLAVTKRIVEAQGGHVGVISALGAGSTFFAEMPVGGVEPPAAAAEVHRFGEPRLHPEEAAA